MKPNTNETNTIKSMLCIEILTQFFIIKCCTTDSHWALITLLENQCNVYYYEYENRTQRINCLFCLRFCIQNSSIKKKKKFKSVFQSADGIYCMKFFSFSFLTFVNIMNPPCSGAIEHFIKKFNFTLETDKTPELSTEFSIKNFKKKLFSPTIRLLFSMLVFKSFGYFDMIIIANNLFLNFLTFLRKESVILFNCVGRLMGQNVFNKTWVHLLSPATTK